MKLKAMAKFDRKPSVRRSSGLMPSDCRCASSRAICSLVACTGPRSSGSSSPPHRWCGPPSEEGLRGIQPGRAAGAGLPGSIGAPLAASTNFFGPISSADAQPASHPGDHPWARAGGPGGANLADVPALPGRRSTPPAVSRSCSDPEADASERARAFAAMDGLLLPGGADLDPGATARSRSRPRRSSRVATSWKPMPGGQRAIAASRCWASAAGCRRSTSSVAARWCSMSTDTTRHRFPRPRRARTQ